MIDKADIRIPSRVPLADRFSWIGEQLRRTGSVDRCPPSQHYRAVVDLRREGLSALLHAGLKHGPAANHKLEIVDAGEMSYRGILRTVEAIFPVDPRPLEIIRIDLCADVYGITVGWFVNSARVLRKRFGANVGTLDFQRMGRVGVETAYFGRRPNCFRIYDKIAERRSVYAKLSRKFRRLERIREHLAETSPEIVRNGPRDKQLPSFEQWSGLDETRMCTRVERQIGGGRIPGALDSLGKLTKLEEYNPFSALVIDPGGLEIPKRTDYPLDVWMAGLHYRRMIFEDGYDSASRWLRKQAGPHAARALEKYKAFVPHLGLGITSEELHTKFRESVRAQLCSPETQQRCDSKLHSFPEAFSSKILPEKECEIET
jgi:hypothetical protein